MPIVTAHNPGTFCWIDLFTPNLLASSSFYEHMFGWSAEQIETSMGEYVMFRREGKAVAGANGLPVGSSVPPMWLPYVCTKDAEEIEKSAIANGGVVVLPPTDVMSAGRTMTLQDPVGATLSVWQPGEHPGAALVGSPGSLTWVELATSDRNTALGFYKKVFGWKVAEREIEPNVTYAEMEINGVTVGGALQMTEQWGGVPSHWSVYIGVTDCELATERAKSLGAVVTLEPHDIEGVGRFAHIRDPLGAALFVIALNEWPA